MTENNSEVLKVIDEMIENLKFTPDEELSAQYKLCENGVITCLFRDMNEMFDSINVDAINHHSKKCSVHNSPAHTP